MKIKWFALLLFPITFFADILVDPKMSPYASAEDILFVFNSLEKGEDALIPRDFRERHPGLSTFGRISEIVLFWVPLGSFSSVVQHEVFGHGYRLRSLGHQKGQVTGYQLGLYKGATWFTITPNMTTAEFTATTVAGIEAQEILAKVVQKHWILKGECDARQARLYTMSRLTPLLYALADSIDLDTPSPFNGHDIKAYADELNLLYPGLEMRQSKLVGKALVNLLDVTYFNAVYSLFKYMACGNNATFWAIPCGSYCYLPGATVYFAPYGVEYGLNNLLLGDKRLYQFYVKGGETQGRQYGGLGLQLNPLFSLGALDLGLAFDLWRQPSLKTPSITLWLDEPFQYTPLGPDIWGGRAGFLGALNLTKSKRYQLLMEAGVKSAGYLPGYNLVGGGYIRGGARLCY